VGKSEEMAIDPSCSVVSVNVVFAILMEKIYYGHREALYMKDLTTS
jgi:hypothetical protein